MGIHLEQLKRLPFAKRTDCDYASINVASGNATTVLVDHDITGLEINADK